MMSKNIKIVGVALLSSLLALSSYNVDWATTTKLPTVASGRIVRLSHFPSRYVATRNIDIWLPEGYNSTRTYPVTYMHDGQMLFDSTRTWNHQEWQVDECLTKLVRTGKAPAHIVVGIWHHKKLRHAEYFPQAVLSTIPTATRKLLLKKQLNDTPLADNYLKFIVNELKPFIDSTYSTQADSEHTFLMGSSMGGLISLYGLCEYPQVFGGAACLSMHSPLAAYELINNQTDHEVASKFRKYLVKHLPPANSHKLYFDCGSLTGDAYYPPYQTKIDSLVSAKGYTAACWQSQRFPGASHSETSWGKRLDVPFTFLLSK